MMTDRGRRVSWAAYAVLTPATAAVFAVSTSWASSQAPTGFASPSTPADAGVNTSAGAKADPAQQVLDEEAARVAALERRVESLRAELAALKKSSIAPGGTAPPSTRAKASRSASTGSTAAGQGAARPAPRPPAVHTVTGASGARR